VASLQLDLVPGDMVTATAGKAIGARFSGYPNPSSDLLEQVANALELRDYPGLGLVPTTTSVTAPADGNLALVELKPAAELLDAWYVLSLTTLPSGVHLGPGVFAAPPPLAGVSSIRFHPRSHPAVRQVEFCKKGDGRYVAVTGFSEPVASTGFASLIHVEQSGTTCETFPASAFSFSDEKACTGFSIATPLHFIVNEGLKSESGASFATFAGAATMDETIDVSKLPKESDDCWLWRL
jgi:hypothetical protein